MKIERMDYVNVKDFTLDELLILEELMKEQGYTTVEEVSDYHKTNYLHYGVDHEGDTLFYDLFFTDRDGRDISEEFRNYLNSLDKCDDKPAQEDTEEETPTEYLTVKERLLALADGKELEWYDYMDEGVFHWYDLESFQSDFGDILYDESTKVRVKPDDPIKCAYDKLALPKDMTTFDIFKAGYNAAKEND